MSTFHEQAIRHIIKLLIRRIFNVALKAITFDTKTTAESRVREYFRFLLYTR